MMSVFKTAGFIALWGSIVVFWAGCNQSPIHPASKKVAEPKLPAIKPAMEPVIKPLAFTATKYRELSDIFSHHGYDLATLDQGAPPLVLSAFPQDLTKIRSSKEKKRLFFLTLLPMVILANQELELKRERVEELAGKLDHGQTLLDPEKEELRQLARSYRLKKDPVLIPRVRELLLKRVDTIPTELVLAQAANESAWGTSRFVQAANNLFGEWTFIPGTGLVPENRPEGAIYEVRRFDNLYASVQSYMKNLNCHPAYKPLRDLRYRLRHRGHSLDGHTLAAGLTKYSSRGQAYVDDLRKLIRQNRLVQFADVALRPAIQLSIRETAAESTGS